MKATSIYLAPEAKPPAVQRFRASKPKVRSGCVTCKSRRIKCDESKPECQRCQSSLRVCSWPNQNSIEDQKLRARAKPLLPRYRTQTGQAILPEPFVQLYADNQESRYFQLFCSETSRELSGAFDLSFWNQIVLQTCHHHPFIRDAVITIGSLNSRAKSQHPPSDHFLDFFDNSSSLPGYGEEQFALRHYERFLKGSRNLVSKGMMDTQSIRLALITCLLVIYIEGLQWHHHNAMSYVWSGMSLLNDWLAGERRRGKRLTCVSSPSPLTVEDGIVQQFKLLEAETALLCDRRPKEHHERLRNEGSETVESMPPVFMNVEEARLLLDLISRRVQCFIVSVRPGKLGGAVFGTTIERPGFSITMDTAEAFEGLTEQQRKSQDSYAQELCHWTKAFNHLSETTKPDSPQYLGVNHLKIRSRMLVIMLFGELSATELVYDAFLPQFKEIVSLAKSHFAHPSAEKVDPKGVYNLNAGLIYPLHITADKCRDRIVRREAIDLMVNRPWREGIVWSLSNGSVGAYLMEVEEEGVDTYDIPEHARVRLLEVSYTEHETFRRGFVKCVRGIGDSKEVKTETWDWSKGEAEWQRKDRQSLKVQNSTFPPDWS